jgi:hypothetical protein
MRIINANPKMVSIFANVMVIEKKYVIGISVKHAEAANRITIIDGNSNFSFFF